MEQRCFVIWTRIYYRGIRQFGICTENGTEEELRISVFRSGEENQHNPSGELSSCRQLKIRRRKLTGERNCVDWFFWREERKEPKWYGNCDTIDVDLFNIQLHHPYTNALSLIIIIVTQNINIIKIKSRTSFLPQHDLLLHQRHSSITFNIIANLQSRTTSSSWKQSLNN